MIKLYVNWKTDKVLHRPNTTSYLKVYPRRVQFSVYLGWILLWSFTKFQRLLSIVRVVQVHDLINECRSVSLMCSKSGNVTIPIIQVKLLLSPGNRRTWGEERRHLPRFGKRTSQALCPKPPSPPYTTSLCLFVYWFVKTLSKSTQSISPLPLHDRLDKRTLIFVLNRSCRTWILRNLCVISTTRYEPVKGV